MKTILMLTLCLFAVKSMCQSSLERKKYEDAALKYCTSKFGAGGLILVENLKLESRDTLTECKSFKLLAINLKRKSERAYEDAQILNKKYELEKEKAGLHKELFGDDSILTKSSLADAAEAKRAYEEKYSEVLKLRERYIAYDVDFAAGNCNSKIKTGWMCNISADFIEAESGKIINSGSLILVFNDNFRVLELE